MRIDLYNRLYKMGLGRTPYVTISEALDWIREEKVIPCSVRLKFKENNKEWFYYGEWGLKGDSRVFETKTYNTHSEASFALLNAIVNHLENK